MTSATSTLTTPYQRAINIMQPAITALLRQYEGFGIPDTGVVSRNDLPQAQINDFLQNLDINFPGANHRKLKLAIRSRLIRLGCFRYRVLAKQQGTTTAVWNPLEISLTQFKNNYFKHDIIYREAADAYPAEDLISDWITQKLPENLYKD